MKFAIKSLFRLDNQDYKRESLYRSEEVSLNERREVSFNVKVLDTATGKPSYCRLTACPEGLSIMDVNTHRHIKTFMFNEIKCFRMNPANPKEYQIQYRNEEGTKLHWCTFTSAEACQIYNAVYDIVDSIVRDKTMFEDDFSTYQIQA